MSIRNNKHNLLAIPAGLLGWAACIYYDWYVVACWTAAIIVTNGLYAFSDLYPKLSTKREQEKDG